MKTYEFEDIVDLLAAIKACEDVREDQKWATCRGTSLSRKQIVETFNDSYSDMYKVISSARKVSK